MSFFQKFNQRFFPHRKRQIRRFRKIREQLHRLKTQMSSVRSEAEENVKEMRPVKSSGPSRLPVFKETPGSPAQKGETGERLHSFRCDCRTQAMQTLLNQLAGRTVTLLISADRPDEAPFFDFATIAAVDSFVLKAEQDGIAYEIGIDEVYGVTVPEEVLSGLTGALNDFEEECVCPEKFWSERLEKLAGTTVHLVFERGFVIGSGEIEKAGKGLALIRCPNGSRIAVSVGRLAYIAVQGVRSNENSWETATPEDDWS